MPRYYFDLLDGKGFHQDEIGVDFDNFEDARDQLQFLLPNIACDELPGGEFWKISCNMRNETGDLVYSGELMYRGTRL